MRRSRIGYRAVKSEEKTPATMDSHVTRTLLRREAKRRLRAATSAEERVLALWLSVWRRQEKIRARGVTPMRASWYTGRGAYLNVC